MAEGLEGLGYETRANKAWQSRQNGEERIKRERCKRLHLHRALPHQAHQASQQLTEPFRPFAT